MARFTEIASFSRFGGDLLSHVLRRSTIGVSALNGRVRDGIGCFTDAMTTNPRKQRKHRPVHVSALADFMRSLFSSLCVFGVD